MLKTRVVAQEDAPALRMALKVLRRGGMVAFATDTVYGLGVLACDESAVARLYQAKQRSQSKAIAVLIGDMEQLAQVASNPSEAALRLANHFWPGALTLVMERHPALPRNLSPLDTIGVRMPDHAFARQLLRAAGPMAVTSANLSGAANPTNAGEVLAQLNGRVELLVDGGQTAQGVPSTVVDCTRHPALILRHGALATQVQHMLQNQG